MSVAANIVAGGQLVQGDLLTDGRGGYGAAYADPPWRFDTYSRKGRRRSPDGREEFGALPLLGVEAETTTERHYKTMDVAAIAALPIGQLMAPHAVLFMWAVFNMLPEAIAVGEAWGFTLKTARVWAKLNPKGWNERRSIENNFAIGTGYIARGNPEPLLIFTRGKPRWRKPTPRALIIAPRREHSRKPDGIREQIAAQVAGPYLEVFARTRAPGWDAWGDQVDRFQPEERSP